MCVYSISRMPYILWRNGWGKGLLTVCVSRFQLATAPVPLVGPVIYGPDGRIMSAAAPPGFIPGSLYGSGTERIDICPYFAQGKCNNLICPLLHPGTVQALGLSTMVVF